MKIIHEELPLISRLEDEIIISIYSMMKKIRLVEERIVEEYPKQEIRCPTHLSIGQEGVPAALSTLIEKDSNNATINPLYDKPFFVL